MNYFLHFLLRVFNPSKATAKETKTLTMNDLKDLDIIKELTMESLRRKNFKPHEFFHSTTAIRHGINNGTDDQEILKNLMIGADKVQELKNYIISAFGDVPIVISSGYRCPEVNSLVGGAIASWHMNGSALDIRVPNFSLDWLLQMIVDSGISFDKILVEKSMGCIHVQWYDKDRFNRNFIGTRP